jgi:putative OPT family oligopeptide transporter
MNMARSHIALLLLGTCAITLGLYHYLIDDIGITVVATVSMIVMSFFFVAVASYIVGLVGSSNSPVSGMTICAVLATAGLLVLFGFSGEKGIIATLGVAGVVCCAACSAGDISQDLKTGYLIGATPKSQQWMEVVGAAIPAFVMAPVIQMLHHAYGIGTTQPGSLAAPQATLFASLVKGIFGQGNIPWNMVAIGLGIGVVIILVDQTLRIQRANFRMPVMAVAVGMYLPLTLAVPMLLGGIAASMIKNRSESGNGVLVSSGFIAGEAIAGVLLGIAIYSLGGPFGFTLPEASLLSKLSVGSSIFALVGLALLLYIVDRKSDRE